MKNLSKIQYKKEFISTVQQRGQVTLPVQIRKLLGVTPQTKVIFVAENSNVKIKASPLSLEDAFGYIKKANNKPQNFDKQIKIAKEGHAKEIANKIIF
ncbi:type II toxin-antitoxin system PrlF family antitoxin [Patescibacteria group bacterium]|nr:type II toxin-antitoxin system PrlF family antitoxin [Patescibacteria group bacterium]